MVTLQSPMGTAFLINKIYMKKRGSMDMHFNQYYVGRNLDCTYTSWNDI